MEMTFGFPSFSRSKVNEVYLGNSRHEDEGCPERVAVVSHVRVGQSPSHQRSNHLLDTRSAPGWHVRSSFLNLLLEFVWTYYFRLSIQVYGEQLKGNRHENTVWAVLQCSLVQYLSGLSGSAARRTHSWHQETVPLYEHLKHLTSWVRCVMNDVIMM